MKWLLLAILGPAAALAANPVALLQKRQAPITPCSDPPLPPVGSGSCNTHPLQQQCGGASRGRCKSAICVCATGFGGKNCELEVPDYLEVNSTATGAKWQGVNGKYKLHSMYLRRVSPDGSTRFLHYEDESKGWGLSSFGTGCIDDSCFFSYSPDAAKPPRDGYVYGNDILYMYKAKLVQKVDKYDASIAFVPAKELPATAQFANFNGEYELAPYYINTANPKFAIFPVDFNVANRNWVLTGVIDKKRTVILKSIQGQGPDFFNNSPIGTTAWLAAQEVLGGADPFSGTTDVKNACANHVGDLTCLMTKGQCLAETTDSAWIKGCCRMTCDRCDISRAACSLPRSPKLAK